MWEMIVVILIVLFVVLLVAVFPFCAGLNTLFDNFIGKSDLDDDEEDEEDYEQKLEQRAQYFEEELEPFLIMGRYHTLDEHQKCQYFVILQAFGGEVRFECLCTPKLYHEYGKLIGETHAFDLKLWMMPPGGSEGILKAELYDQTGIILDVYPDKIVVHPTLTVDLVG